jgi:hypothetical protein
MPDAPENYKFGGGASATLLHPLVLVGMILAVILLLVLPRKYVIAPVIIMAFLTPIGQQIYVVGLHLFVLRIVVLVAFIRALASRSVPDEPRFAGGWTNVDSAFTFYVLSIAIASVLLFHETGMLINQVGYLWDYLLAYFALRILIRDEADVYFVLKCLAVATVPLAIGMIIEQRNMVNVFGMLGGTSLVPQVREGKVRSQGAFEHSLMAGVFAATTIPAMFLLWRTGKAKLFGSIGLLGATLMMWMTNSSSPLLAYVAGIFALLCWPLRKSMKKVRYGIVFALVGLQLVMKAPVWFLIERVDVTGSSSGYHRAELVDQFIHHFWDWWLIGVKDSSSWGLDMFDVQNQYVNVGEMGGLLAFIFFILVISRSFAMLGNARKAVDGDKDQEWILWCLGSAMFANVVGFFGVNYFDQSRVWWFILLAMISAIASPILLNSPAAAVVSDTTSAGSGRLTRVKSPLRPDAKPLATRSNGQLAPKGLRPWRRGTRRPQSRANISFAAILSRETPRFLWRA